MATSKYITDGVSMPYTPGSAVSAGDVVVIGEIVAHAPRDIAANVEGSVTIKGVVRFPKTAASAGAAISQGTKLYWNAAGQVVTTSASGNKVAGYAFEAALTTDTTVDVDLARA